MARQVDVHGEAEVHGGQSSPWQVVEDAADALYTATRTVGSWRLAGKEQIDLEVVHRGIAPTYIRVRWVT